MDNSEASPAAQNLEEVLRKQLGDMHPATPEIYVGNERTTLEDALERCVREQSVYMPDYIMDETGALKQLRFDKIDLQ